MVLPGGGRLALRHRRRRSSSHPQLHTAMVQLWELAADPDWRQACYKALCWAALGGAALSLPCRP